ncbi:nuclease-related domain-containing protein [Bacillus aerolatus]|uniref:nuclease-related domain-containing protein n=1 Tax=Bacillus aerolatus TaxID=2653354 RepID=UPI00178516A9|nr:nuclease-related domain-containing protein [Bacillus aerolatus]
MIVKKREVPLKIHKLEALARRLPELHAKRPDVEAELAKSWAGHRGEEALDYHLTFLEEGQHMIFHGLRLPGANGHFFQIDTLILCANMAVILETKNIAGTLYFDQFFHQLLRTQEDSEDIFSDPLLQIRRQKRQLTSWLANRKITDIPIAPFVVISFPTTKITTDPEHKEVLQKVIHAATVPYKIERLHQLHQTSILKTKDLKKAAHQLVTQHVPHNPDLLKQFQISEAELLKGAQCPACQHIPMKRMKGKWHCLRCNHRSSDAHIQALTDYALLHNNTMTNRTFREYLQIDSRSIATHLLRTLKLQHSGSQKNRTYQLPTIK